MSTGKRRCQTISLAPMAFIHPRYKAVYLTTSSNVTDRPTAVSFLYTRMSSYLTMWLKTVLFLNCYYYYFVPVAPGSSICSERFGLLRKCRAEQCVGEWESAGRRLKQALRCLCCFSSFFFSSSISLCLLLLLATVINRTSLVRVLLLFFIVLFFFFVKPHRWSQIHAEIWNWKISPSSTVIRSSYSKLTTGWEQIKKRLCNFFF